MNGKNFKALYILPYPKFFSQFNGIGGAIAHSYGIISGFNGIGIYLDIIVEEAHDVLNNEANKVFVLPSKGGKMFNRVVWNNKIIKFISDLNKSDYKFVYMRYSTGFAPWVSKMKKKFKNIPLVIEVNSLGLQKHKPLKFLEKRVLNYADLIIVISEQLKEIVLKELGADLENKIVVIPNGVDIKRFNNIAGRSFGEDGIIKLGYTGLLNKDYGLEVVLEGFQKLQQFYTNTSLEIYGDGTYKEELKEIGKKINGVMFHGPVPFMRMPEIIKSFDIPIVSRSKKIQYGSPTKLFEYMAAEKPVVSAEAPQINDLLGKEEKGLTFPINDIDVFVEQCKRLIEDANLREKISQNAKAEIEKNHTWEKRIIKLLSEIEKRFGVDLNTDVMS